MEFLYAPTSHGRKAVYLTLASLGFLILAMVGVLTSSHGQEQVERSNRYGVEIGSTFRASVLEPTETEL